jgi:hypothetical protein
VNALSLRRQNDYNSLKINTNNTTEKRQWSIIDEKGGMDSLILIVMTRLSNMTLDLSQELQMYKNGTHTS